MEKWAEAGEPTVQARLAEAKAFLELRMVDKAVVRVRDLAEASPPNIDALLVIGESHLLRGWNREARKTAERGLELQRDHQGFRALLERAAESPTNPDDEAIEPDNTAPAELVRVAEHQMAQGSYVRARALLERVRRKVPEHRWARDLLWAMDGEYTSEGSLAELCERLGPELPVLPEIADEPERTESGQARDFDLDDRRASHAFPALFRNLSTAAAVPEDTGTEPELTMVSGMAASAELQAADTSDRTDPGGDDTQIVRILKAGKPGTPPRAADPGDTAVNLAQLPTLPPQRQDPGRRVSSDFASTDDEDDALIVHTRREDSTDGTDRRDRGGLTEELEIEQKATARGAVEDAHWAATPLAAAPRPPAAAVAPPHRRVDAAAQGKAGPSGKLAAKAPPATPTPVPASRAARPPSGGPPTAVSLWLGAVIGLFVLAGIAFVFLAIVLAFGS